MKRFLGIILVTVMVIALLPSAFATTDAETEKTVYKYEFTLAGAGETGDAVTNKYIGDLTAKELTVGMKNADSDKGGIWEYIGCRGLCTGNTDGNLVERLTADGLWAYGKGNTNTSDGIVFKITVPADGDYVPSLNYLPYKYFNEPVHVFLFDDEMHNTSHNGKTYYFETRTENPNIADTVYYAMTAWNENKSPALMTHVLSGEAVSADSNPNSANIKKITGTSLSLSSGEYYLLIVRGTTTAASSGRFLPYINSFELEKVPVTKYEFTLGATGQTADHYNSLLYGDTDVPNTKAIEKGTGNGDWSYVGARGDGVEATGKNYLSQLSDCGFWWYAKGYSEADYGNNGLVFKINVPADGEYATTLNYMPSYAGGTVYACIIDESINEKLHTNGFSYNFDTNTENSISYALAAVKSSTDNNVDLRKEIKLALSDELTYANTNKVTPETAVSISGTDTVALKEGEYYLLIASAGGNGYDNKKWMPYINSFEIEKVGELDEALDAAFAVNKQDDYKYTAPTVDGLTDDGAIDPVSNGDGTYKLTAPEENEAGEKFLYWARGLTKQKRIVSFDRIIKNYVPTEDGRNFLIAVYDSEGPTEENAEYYNANGQLIAIGDEPKELSMAGYGNVTDWNRYGEKHIYVAEYDNKTQPDNVTVTVNGEDRIVPYGNPVTCTADAADGSGNPFKCWKKTNLDGTSEIVSIDKKYTFKAWEPCTVTAEYEEHSFVSVVMKIITDSFDAGSEKGIMAEFVGFDNKVAEKGIMFGDNRIAMTAPGSQFSVIADKNGTYKGYAIVKNTDGTYSLITGNEITVGDIAE